MTNGKHGRRSANPGYYGRIHSCFRAIFQQTVSFVFLCQCLSEKQMYFLLLSTVIRWNVTICISVFSVHEFCNNDQPKDIFLSFWLQRHPAKPYFSSSPLHLPYGKYCGRDKPLKIRRELFPNTLRKGPPPFPLKTLGNTTRLMSVTKAVGTTPFTQIENSIPRRNWSEPRGNTLSFLASPDRTLWLRIQFSRTDSYLWDL